MVDWGKRTIPDAGTAISLRLWLRMMVACFGKVPVTGWGLWCLVMLL